MPAAAVDIIKKIKHKKQEETNEQQYINKKGKDIHKLMSTYISRTMRLHAPDTMSKSKVLERKRQAASM